MNELQQLKEQLSEISKKIEDIENKQKEPKRWVPGPGDEYWYFTEVTCCLFKRRHSSTDFDDWLIAVGNFYKTEKEAEEAAKKKHELDKLKYEIKCWIEDNDTVQLNWVDTEKQKYTIYFSHLEQKWDSKSKGSYYCQGQEVGAFYVSNNDLAKQLIDTFADRLHLLLEEWN